MRRRMLVSCIAAALALPALAHDTWFVRDAGGLQLVTGNRFPLADLRVPPDSVVRSACAVGTCWAELPAYDIELAPDKIPIYLREIQAGDAERATWSRWHADGLAWHERYRKFARIEWDVPAATDEARSRSRVPVGEGLELVVLGGAPVTTGRTIEFQLLRDGAPVADFPIELVSERQRFGVWRRTDAKGVLQHTLPFPGQWLLRGTLLEPSREVAGRWDSRFVTLVVQAR